MSTHHLWSGRHSNQCRRVQVLQAHKLGVTACSFCPDGRKLVSISLEDSCIRVWRIHGGAANTLYNTFLTIASGAGAVEQHLKELKFNIGDEGQMNLSCENYPDCFPGRMTTAATLEWVRFEWDGEERVRCKIRDTVLALTI